MAGRTVSGQRSPREAAATILIHPVLLILFFAQPKYLPQPPLEHRFRRAPAAPVQPVLKVLHPDDVRHLGVPDLDGDGRQPASDIADSVVNVQGGEGMGDGFVKGLGFTSRACSVLFRSWMMTVQLLSATKTI
jgi:hypothetical protein